MKRKYKVDRVFEVNENDSVRDANDEFDSGYVWADVERFINYYGTEIEEPKKPVTYCCGDRFQHKATGFIYRLCVVRPYTVRLLAADGLSFWCAPEVTVADLNKISEKELSDILVTMGNSFTKIEDSE